MIVECPHCKSLLRAESRGLNGASLVRCGACMGEFDALEHINVDADLDAPAGVVRKRSVAEPVRIESPDNQGPAVQQRQSVLAATTAQSGPSRPWIAGCIALLLALLGVTFLHINRDALSTTSLGYALTSRWCDLAQCTVSTPNDYSAIRLLRRQIYAHPSREDALIISLAMVNDAHFAQDFPVLHVRMTDQAGDMVARGEFPPAEYLDTFDTSVLMQPGRAIDVQLEVADPGARAVAFDLEFR